MMPNGMFVYSFLLFFSLAFGRLKKLDDSQSEKLKASL
jgi:hypothetical protein